MEEKLLLVAINSKYTHSNLAVRYLKVYTEKYSNYKVEIYETTINNHLDEIISDIYDYNINKVCFSVYIWNIDYTKKIINELKKIKPSIEIILGGPEVTYDYKNLMQKIKGIDYIIKGEGEKALLNLLKFEKEEWSNLIYRDEKGELVESETHEPIKNLDEIPFPYTEFDIKNNLENRIIYYESSRGCPFNCSYCISSIDKRLRFFSVKRVKEDLFFFIKHEIKLIKFVDRTYNLDKKRYLEIWRFLLNNYTGKTSFHFEISADLFDDEVLEFLKAVPKGYFQFEVGVQTTNIKTLKAVNRNSDLDKLFKNIKAINKNIHMHLDLIAGLPYENFEIFQNSFNMVYSLRPEMLQLGFLKILKGTQISEELEKYEYENFEFSPYEVLKNKFISYKELLKLKQIEEILDLYYNSGKFKKTLDYIDKKYNGNFNFYKEFADYWEEKKYFKIAHKRPSLYNYFYEFIILKGTTELLYFKDCLKYDYLSMGKPGEFPYWYNRIVDKDLYNDELKKLEFKTIREAHKKTEFESFEYNLETGEEKNSKVIFFYNFNGESFFAKEIL